MTSSPYRLALLGSPVAQSLSPHLHRTAGRLAGVPIEYTLREIHGPDLPRAIQMAGEAGMRGLNFTAPHKAAAVSLVSTIDPLAAEVGAVNTVVFDGPGDGRGYNTDVWGFNWALGADRPARAGLVGGGGAARAVACALRSQQSRVVVFNRGQERLLAMRGLVGDHGSIRGLHDLETALSSLDLLVVCTPPVTYPWLLELPLERLREGSRVITLGYGRESRDFCRRLETRGLGAQDGLAMLAAQGQQAFELWTGKKVPIEPVLENLQSVAASRWDD